MQLRRLAPSSLFSQPSLTHFRRISLHRTNGWKSVSRRLPLLISGLLIAALVAFASVGYEQLTSALMVAAKDRVESASSRLARSFESAPAHLRTDLTRTASDSTVRRLMGAEDPRNRAAA